MTDKQRLEQNPIEIVDVEPELNEELLKYFPGNKKPYMRIGPKGYLFREGLKKEVKNIYSLPLKPTDTFVVTFPRSGTTWTQEIVWLIKNDLNYDKAKIIPLADRYVFLELNYLLMFDENHLSENDEFINEAHLEFINDFMSTSPIDLFANMPPSRFVKSHLPLSLLPPNLLDTCKIVYVARDVRDVAVSYYHFHKLVKYFAYVGDFKTFWNLFMRNLTLWGPFFEQVKEAWNLRHHHNMLFLFYEELTKDLPATVRRIADFFGKKYDDKQFAGLCEHVDIENFKKNKSINHANITELVFFEKSEKFIRKGNIGGWREYFDEEMSAQAEQWIQDNLKDTDLRFPAKE